VNLLKHHSRYVLLTERMKVVNKDESITEQRRKRRKEGGVWEVGGYTHTNFSPSPF